MAGWLPPSPGILTHGAPLDESGNTGHDLERLAEADGVVDGGVDVAAGDRVADAEQAIAAVRVGDQGLRLAGNAVPDAGAT